MNPEGNGFEKSLVPVPAGGPVEQHSAALMVAANRLVARLCEVMQRGGAAVSEGDARQGWAQPGSGVARRGSQNKV